MIRPVMAAVTLAAATIATSLPAAAQTEEARTVAGTRLDVVATGEVTRVPDIARINAGVVTQAQTAQEAIRQNGAKMTSVRAALERAGIAARDIQTSNVASSPTIVMRKISHPNSSATALRTK